jgi:putative membrane protein
MLLGPLWMVLWLVLLVMIVVAVIRWFGAPGDGERSARSARDILDERYARGEIDRDEYMKRKQDIASS